MQNFQLAQARKVMLTELRRAAQGDLPTGLALDVEYLFDLIASGPGSARSNVLGRTLILRGLRALGIGADVIAKRYQLTPAELAHELERPLLEDSAVAAAIADKVNEALRETPETGRAQAPAGDFAIPGMSYPLDPRLVGEGR